MGHLVSSLAPTAAVLPYAGVSAPKGWLLCDGSAISRETYASLFEAIGTMYGSGDGETTFNIPDYRWTFLRGHGPNLTATGDGTAGNGLASFTGHQFNRTGMKVRMISGTLSGLALNTDYYVIVNHEFSSEFPDTIGFATTKNNALEGTRISISGTNTAVIQQWEDPDITERRANAVGGDANPDALGTFQRSEFGRHSHSVRTTRAGGRHDVGYLSDEGGGGPFLHTESGPIINSGGNETRPSNISVNYIIKI